MKVLFVVPSYKNGGTMSCLRNMVPMLTKKDLQLFVFAITDLGPNKEFLSNYCVLLNSLGESTRANNSFVSKLALIVKKQKKLLEKIGIDISPFIFKKVARGLQKQNFNLVVAYQEDIATKFCSYFDKTRKIAWIHCDYARYLTEPKVVAKTLKLYSRFERIICVSEYTCKHFLSVIPELANKTLPLHNIVNDNLIIERSKEPVKLPWGKDEFSIVSVGRFDKVKRFEYIPQIASEVKKTGVKFQWVLIGGGNEEIEKEIRSNLSKYDVGDCLVLQGETNNPYPFIANSDLLVCLSTTEACPNVINEAKILHVPIISTNFGSVNEFVEDHYNGLIAPIEHLGETISEVIGNNLLYSRLKNNLDSFKYDNEGIVYKLENDLLK